MIFINYKLVNLKAELVRKEINQNELAKRLNITTKTLSNKLNCKSEFTLLEILEIKKIIKDKTLEFLFEIKEVESSKNRILQKKCTVI